MVVIVLSFDVIWENIENLAGEQFFTKTGLPFTYRIVEGCVVPDRTNFPLEKSNFEKAASIEKLSGPGQINKLVWGPAYVFAILTDDRIR